MTKQYSAEFKMEAVRRVQNSGMPVARVAEELGINENTLRGWMKNTETLPMIRFRAVESST